MATALEKKNKPEMDSVKVLVAVKAAKEIPKTALIWALTHVVQAGDCITLLVVISPQTSGIGRRFWMFPRFSGDCANRSRKFSSALSDQKSEISDFCSQMILQLHDVYDPNKINVKIKVVSGSPCGSVAAEAKSSGANWVVLEKDLKQEEKICIEQLQCNIVAMKKSQPKVLRLNLVRSSKRDSEETPRLPSKHKEVPGKQSKNDDGSLKMFIRGPAVTPASSPEFETPLTRTEVGTSSMSSSDQGTSPFLITEIKHDKKEESFFMTNHREVDESDPGSEGEDLSSSARFDFKPWMTQILDLSRRSSRRFGEILPRNDHGSQVSTSGTSMDVFSRFDSQNRVCDTSLGSEMREAISLSRSAPLGAPPLCSICQHKAPVFGKPPRWFSYAELELATAGFSKANFLAEGGFGSVHRGILSDGQAIAVKQHKPASSQGDIEFCSEVEVLSCAQHRNVVMLIGYCIEGGRRLLVYEYICNGSLDYHLWGSHHQEPLEWPARQKIAVGAARGLRYLHEECRVGCIVHRDMRPNNILITHDYEPLVGDFGLARWQPDGDTGIQTRVIGTFGYLAPEYTQSGQITEKTDVYSFGVVLLELVTGRKAVDLNRPKGQQCLTEWARPLLREYAIDELVDPQLGNCYSDHEICAMLHAASVCVRQDPYLRPRMSQVLRMLEEGDAMLDPSHALTSRYDVGNCSRRIWERQQHFEDVAGVDEKVNLE